MQAGVLIVAMAAAVAMGVTMTASAGDWPGDATVIVTLAHGQSPATAETREGRNFEIELSRQGGVWSEVAWGYAMSESRADHDGVITAQQVGADGSVRMSVRFTLNADRWSQPGEARYELLFAPGKSGIVGTYTGQYRDQAVEGQITGATFPLWWKARAGFEAIKPGEHPRLVFRKSDLPLLRQRMETPEGKAIMGRLMAMVNVNPGKAGKSRSWYAAGLGMGYQLTGEASYAEQAQQYLTQEVLGNFSGLSQDIHHGPYAMGVALAYDLCYDAWPDAFRRQVADWLAERIQALSQGGTVGKSMSGYNPNPWSNHNGIRAAATGVCALAILGDGTTRVESDAALARVIHIVGRDIRRHMLLGLGASGWFLEGDFYKTMTWNAGPGHFVQAYRSALGGDPLAGWNGAYTLLGEWMQQPPSDSAPKFAAGDHQTSGMWSVGMCTVLPEHRAGFRWLFDRTFGIAGNGTFGIGMAHQAGYALALYPFDTPAAPPETSLPWAAPDERKGYYQFRKPWKDGRDFLTIVHLKSESMRGAHYERAGDCGDLRVWGLGRQWVGGVSLVNTGVRNDFLGGKTTYFEHNDRGQAVLSATLDDYYLQAIPSKGKAPDPAELKENGQSRVTVPRAPGGFIDAGIRAQRYMAIDHSGASGAPGLYVILDRVQGGLSRAWNLALAKAAGPVKVEGNRFIVGDPSGVHMAGVLAGSAGTKLGGALTATGGDEYFVVFTVQEGPAPVMSVEGEGVNATFRVGGQTVRFDGTKIVLEK